MCVEGGQGEERTEDLVPYRGERRGKEKWPIPKASYLFVFKKGGGWKKGKKGVPVSAFPGEGPPTCSKGARLILLWRGACLRALEGGGRRPSSNLPPGKEELS